MTTENETKINKMLRSAFLNDGGKGFAGLVPPQKKRLAFAPRFFYVPGGFFQIHACLNVRRAL